MRSLPIFLACVSTWRYRLSRAATPTVNRSATTTPSRVVICDMAIHCARASPEPLRLPSAVPSGASLCELAAEGGRVDVVDERALAADLDDRHPLAVARLECRIAADVHLRQLE